MHMDVVTANPSEWVCFVHHLLIISQIKVRFQVQVVVSGCQFGKYSIL